MVGLFLLGAAVSGVATMVFQVIAGRPASIVAGLSTMTALAVLWVLLPLVARRGTSPDVLDS